MKKLCNDILHMLNAGCGGVLLTVCERRGSAPRGLGAAMLIEADGSQKGTIGGGAVEYAATQEAAAMMFTHGSRTLDYRLSASEIAGAGMICGGSVRVLAQYLEPSDENRRLFTQLKAARDGGAQAALVRRLENGSVAAMGWWDGQRLHDVEAQMPESCGSQAWLSADGTLLYEPVGLGTRALLFGGGHVSQRLAPLLEYIDFRCVICEDRSEFARPELFPIEAQVLLGDFSRLGSFTAVHTEDYVVIMTRGHQADYEILRQVLKTDACYIGCIGSRNKIALTRKKLSEDGFSAEECARVHTPIGLPIGAQTPEEIAVSIAAEMIQIRSGR